MSGKYFPLALASGEPAKSVGGGSEVDGREERNGLSFTKRARAERRGEASPIRELGYAEKRR